MNCPAVIVILATVSLEAVNALFGKLLPNFTSVKDPSAKQCILKILPDTASSTEPDITLILLLFHFQLYHYMILNILYHLTLDQNK